MPKLKEIVRTLKRSSLALVCSFFQDLYAQGRSNAGVLFASIPNFADFYSEDVNEGMECIRLLNEIIGKGLKYKWFLNVLGINFHNLY